MTRLVILDLDETLISSASSTEFIYDLERDKLDKFRYFKTLGSYTTFVRPHLDDFLDVLFKNFDVAVWTAATGEYAKVIIEKCILTKPDRELKFVFHREHCRLSERVFGGTKNLQLVWTIFPEYDSSNTLLIDDLDETYHLQPNNVIHAEKFKYSDENSENDLYLLKLFIMFEDIA